MKGPSFSPDDKPLTSQESLQVERWRRDEGGLFRLVDWREGSIIEDPRLFFVSCENWSSVEASCLSAQHGRWSGHHSRMINRFPSASSSLKFNEDMTSVGSTVPLDKGTDNGDFKPLLCELRETLKFFVSIVASLPF